MFNDVQLKIVQFCADECDRQQSGELSVARMVKAYEFAADAVYAPNEDTVQILANLIDPRNAFGASNNYRHVDVYFANGNHGETCDYIPRLVNQLFTIGADMMRDDPEAWVKELLRIHPWVDGNGRTAAIVWNWLNGTLNDPVPYPRQEW